MDNLGSISDGKETGLSQRSVSSAEPLAERFTCLIVLGNEAHQNARKSSTQKYSVTLFAPIGGSQSHSTLATPSAGRACFRSLSEKLSSVYHPIMLLLLLLEFLSFERGGGANKNTI